jgi:hypothetical protein
VALLEQHIDIGPGLGHGMLERHQVVVDGDDVDEDDCEYAQSDETTDAHAALPVIGVGMGGQFRSFWQRTQRDGLTPQQSVTIIFTKSINGDHNVRFDP